MSVLLTRDRRGDPTLADWTPIPRVWENCIIPTYDGSGITTHPSIVDMGRKWNGYRWWQANTPFAGDDIKLENPSIWGSNDRWHWEVPKGLTNPLRKAPGGNGYNSDTELIFDPDNQVMVCMYREVTTENGTRMLAYTSTNGSTWNEVPGALSFPVGGAGSPAIWRAGPGDWRLWAFGVSGLKVYTAPAVLGPWSFASTCTVTNVDPSTMWHGDVIRYRDRWIGAYGRDGNRTCYPITSSDDGLTWTAGTVATMGTAYRPTLLPSPVSGYLDIWTGTSLQFYNRFHESRWPGF